MSYVSFQEMKPRVGIDDVAFSLGYKLNRQAGVGRYIELILPDGPPQFGQAGRRGGLHR